MFMFAFWETSCRDLAKLVQLYLQNGKWNNKQILSAEFVNDARTSSSALNQNYGLLWWLNRAGTTKSTSANAQTRIGPRHQNAPLDMFEAVGACGQSAMGFESRSSILCTSTTCTSTTTSRRSSGTHMPCRRNHRCAGTSVSSELAPLLPAAPLVLL